MVVALILVVLGLAIVAAAVAWGLGWAGAGRGTSLGESFLEAGQRTQDALAEFWEWLRLGR